MFKEGEGDGWDFFFLNHEDGRIFLTRSLNASERCVKNYPVSQTLTPLFVCLLFLSIHNQFIFRETMFVRLLHRSLDEPEKSKFGFNSQMSLTDSILWHPKYYFLFQMRIDNFLFKLTITNQHCYLLN